jgi:hypothetical protein
MSERPHGVLKPSTWRFALIDLFRCEQRALGISPERSVIAVRPEGERVFLNTKRAYYNTRQGKEVKFVPYARLLICPRKQADHRTRVLRELKTKRSRTPLPITQQTATILRDYLKQWWSPNPQNQDGTSR